MLKALDLLHARRKDSYLMAISKLDWGIFCLLKLTIFNEFWYIYVFNVIIMDNIPIDEDYVVMKGSKKEQELRYRDREAYKELKNEQRYRNAPVRKVPEGCGTFILISIIGLVVVTLIAILLTT